jgi:hypothetical protein
VRELLPCVAVPILYWQATRDKTVGGKLGRDRMDRLLQLKVELLDGHVFVANLSADVRACNRSVCVDLYVI